MPLHESQIVAMLWDLVDGRYNLAQTVARLEERIRHPEPVHDWRMTPIHGPEHARPEPLPARYPPEPPKKQEARARADLRRLLALRTPTERRELIDRCTRGMASPRLVERLLAEAANVRGPSPRLALGLVDAALRVAHRVPAAEASAAARRRLILRVQAHRANLLRILGELPAADALWRWIGEHRGRHPSGPPGERAELLSLEASLRIDLREFAAAETLLAEAEGLYRSAGDPVGAAKALLQRGTAAEYAGESERALDLYRRAAEELNPAAEPFLFLASQQNQASVLVDLHRPADSTALLAKHRGFLEQHGDAPLRERWRWTEARIARAEGRFDEAAVGFDQTCNGFLTLHRRYGASLVLLDAAELHLARGDWWEVRKLAGRLEAIFTVRGVHLEARKALILFVNAAREERLTADFLARLRRYLLIGRRDSRFAFDPGAGPAPG
jgi:tetratricopeptide (TPR) repeat protein